MKISIKRWWQAILMLPPLVALTLGAAAAAQSLAVKIRPGDTVSYLAYKHLGRYDSELARRVSELNPHIEDLNRVRPGDTLYLPVAARQPTYRQTTAKGAQAVITLVAGSAEVRPEAAAAWQRATANTILFPGSEVRTGTDGRVELILDNCSVLRLGPETLLHLKQQERRNNGRRYGFLLSAGRMWNRIARALGFGGGHEVETPTVITAVQGTIYDLQVPDADQTRVRVFSGRVLVYNPFAGQLAPGQAPGKLQPPSRVQGPARVSLHQWQQIVLSQYQMILARRHQGGEFDRFEPTQARKEEWVRWNQDRDQDWGAR